MTFLIMVNSGCSDVVNCGWTGRRQKLVIHHCPVGFKLNIHAWVCIIFIYI